MLAALFVVVPLAELSLLIQLGQVVGPWWTILILIADGALGSWLMKREGARAWRALSEALQSGRMPSRELADAALVLVGGVLLITPGFLSDVLGLFCILPVTRPLARRVLARMVARRLTVSVAGTQRPSYADAHDPQDPRTQRRPGDHEVVRGDVVE
ncbi:membrane protein FxsA [Nocardioides marmoribigeumensis]